MVLIIFLINRKKNSRGWSHLCEQPSDDANNGPNGLLFRESKRDRNGVTRNSDRHTQTYGGRMYEPILSFFFSDLRISREDDLRVWKSRLCLHARNAQIAHLLRASAFVLFTHVFTHRLRLSDFEIYLLLQCYDIRTYMPFMMYT